MNLWKHLGKALFLLAFLSSIGLKAQFKPFQFGFKGAVNMGWIKTDADGYENDGVRVGGAWGFVADIYMVENYAFTTGFDILYLNGKLKYPTTYDDGDGNIYEGTLYRSLITRYLQVPISFTMKTNDIKEKFRIYGQIGYGLGFLLNAKGEDEFESFKGEHFSDSKDVYDELTFTRSSLILALGVEVPIHKSTFIRAGFKFDNCFINIYKGENKVRNNLFDFNLAVIF